MLYIIYFILYLIYYILYIIYFILYIIYYIHIYNLYIYILFHGIPWHIPIYIPMKYPYKNTLFGWFSHRTFIYIRTCHFVRFPHCLVAFWLAEFRSTGSSIKLAFSLRRRDVQCRSAVWKVRLSVFFWDFQDSDIWFLIIYSSIHLFIYLSIHLSI